MLKFVFWWRVKLIHGDADSCFAWAEAWYPVAWAAVVSSFDVDELMEREDWLVRVDKHAFTDLVQIHFNDGRLLINNLLEWKDTDARIGQIAANVTFLVAKHAAELALMVNNASFQGDLPQLKHLVKQGAIVAKADYDGRTEFHLAASKGYESVVLFLIREGAIVNDGNNELLRRLLTVGADPSSSDYDKRTTLHIAAAEGNFGMARLLIEYGADIYAQDRCICYFWDHYVLLLGPVPGNKG
ncbi:unnamed protein product [Calypogeia fissa]